MFRTAATKIAHNSTIPSLGGNQPLQDLITAEKALLISLQKLSADFSKASEALRTWGVSEGDDLGDILGSSAVVLNHFSAALSQYASHGQGMREQLKVIRARDENLDEMKRRRRTVFRKADDAEKKLSRMSPESKTLQMQTDVLNRLRDEVRSLDTDIVVEEAALGDFKRSSTKSFMGLKCGGLSECCEKGSIAATFGQMLISGISEEKTQPGLHRPFYQGQAKTERIVAEALRAVNDVTLTTIPNAITFPSTHGQLTHVPERRPYYTEPDTPFVPAGQDEKPIPVPKDSSDYPEFIPSPPVPTFPVPTFSNDIHPSSKSLSQRPNLNPWSEVQVESPSFPLTQERSSIDDFGMNLVRSSTGPMDLNNGPGGRFATFPTKAPRPAASPLPPPPLPTFTLDPLPLQTSHDLGPSFASSIADAFEHSDDPDPFADSTKGSKIQSGLLPLRSASIKPSVSTNPWSGDTSSSRMSNLSDNDDALLAYLMSGDEEGDNSTPRQTSEKNIPSEEQEQPVQEERRGESLEPEPKSDKRISNLEDKRVSGSPSLGGPFAAGATVEREDVYEGPSASSSKLETASLSSSQLSSEEQEKALNAAAAREVTFELESLNARWSPLQNDTVERGRTQSGADWQYGEAAGRDPSPLTPPSAPFARRAVSPHPFHEQSPISSPGVGYSYGPHQPSPFIQPPVKQYSAPSLSPSQVYNTYRPANSPLSGTPITERPSSSMNNPGGVGPGTRTIPAAAFRKPRRMSMENLQGSLSKGLPGSPYPGGTPRIYSASGILPGSASFIPPSEQFEKRLPQPEPDYADPYFQEGWSSGADHEFGGQSRLGEGGYQTGNFSTDLEENGLR